jgi:hypothetical protein
MKSIYDASDNTLQEQSEKKKPLYYDVYLACRSANRYLALTLEDLNAIIEYEDHLKRLRKLPCSPEAGFKDGEVYEEGKDYEVVAPLIAVPLDPLKGEDDIQKVYDQIKSDCKDSYAYLVPGRGLTARDWNRIYEDTAYQFIEHLKQNYSITKKQ